MYQVTLFCKVLSYFYYANKELSIAFFLKYELLIFSSTLILFFIHKYAYSKLWIKLQSSQLGILNQNSHEHNKHLQNYMYDFHDYILAWIYYSLINEVFFINWIHVLIHKPKTQLAQLGKYWVTTQSSYGWCTSAQNIAYIVKQTQNT